MIPFQYFSEERQNKSACRDKITPFARGAASFFCHGLLNKSLVMNWERQQITPVIPDSSAAFERREILDAN